MKRLLISLGLLLALSGQAFAAISSSTVFEVRPTNGLDTNGGGFVTGASGTDRSQQDAAHISRTDLVIGNPATTTLTSAATPFTTDEIGNLINITAGTNFTTGFYEITAVDGSNIATVDRAVGTAGATGGTGAVGGALKSLDVAAAQIVAGNKLWVKDEAWNEAVDMTPGAAGTDALPITIEGYQTARGDEPTGDNRPTNDRASAAGDGIILDARYIVKNIIVKDAGDDAFTFGQAAPVLFINCRAQNPGGVGFENTTNGGIIVAVKCRADSAGDRGYNSGGGSASSIEAIGSLAEGGAAEGFDASSGGNITLKFSISEGNAGHGVERNTVNLSNCTIDGNTGASTDGVSGSFSSTAFIVNTILSNNGRYGIDQTSTLEQIQFMDYNNFFGNGTAPRSDVNVGDHDIALDPTFTDSANNDFSVGTNMKAKGYPGELAGGGSTGYIDIGAVQRQESAAAATTTAYTYVGN